MSTVATPPFLYRAKRVLLGPALHTAELEHQRLGNPTALAVFASDNLSSVAYASEEILRVLLPALGVAAFGFVLPITGAILAVLALLVLSYRQTIKAYPSAGGAYIVTKDNLGHVPAAVAGVALLTDYVLTVAVSAAAGVAAIYSAAPALHGVRVPLCLGFIVLIAYMNLRGVKESGRVFAVPTYGFILAMALLLSIGVVRVLGGLSRHAEIPPAPPHSGWFFGVGLFLVLRAFSNGGSAVTGVEAISNGVPAFRRPEWKNAQKTLLAMGTTLGIMFLGLSFLATRLRFSLEEIERATLISQVGRVVFGESAPGHVAYYYLQVMTAAILILAANTSFADFPRLASFAAEDDYMPRPFSRRGHRLVFSNGILTLAGAAAAVVIVFDADVSRMIPLYALGVFISFTLSQTGMAVKHLKDRESGWRRGLAINGLGAVTTAVVDVVIAITKFKEGAWMVMLAVPIGVLFLVHLAGTYQRERGALQVGMADLSRPAKPKHEVVLLVDQLDASTAAALRYAKQISPFGLHSRVSAVHASCDSEETALLQEAWSANDLPIPLVLIGCADRDVPSAIVGWLSDHERPDTETTVLIPARTYPHVWQRLVHDRTSMQIQRRLRRYPGLQVVVVPFVLSSDAPRIPVELGS